MSLSTYTDLRNAVTGWLHRDDLAASAVDFIALAEARFRRQLRLRQQMTTAALSTVAGTETVALPSGWLQFHSLRLVAPDRVLDFLPAVARTWCWALSQIRSTASAPSTTPKSRR